MLPGCIRKRITGRLDCFWPISAGLCPMNATISQMEKLFGWIKTNIFRFCASWESTCPGERVLHLARWNAEKEICECIYIRSFFSFPPAFPKRMFNYFLHVCFFLGKCIPLHSTANFQASWDMSWKGWVCIFPPKRNCDFHDLSLEDTMVLQQASFLDLYFPFHTETLFHKDPLLITQDKVHNTPPADALIAAQECCLHTWCVNESFFFFFLTSM